MIEPTVLDHDGQVWVPGNRWDLVAARVAAVDLRHTAIVVPYFEQPESLLRMYAALGHLAPATFELAIADDGSAAPPPQPPDGFPLRTTILRQDDCGVRPGAARNMAVAATDADVVVLLDADTVPSPGTVERLAAWPTLVPDALVVGRRRHVDLTGWSPAATVAWLAGTGPTPPVRPDPAWLDAGYRRSDDLLSVDERSYRYVISAVMACHRGLWDDIAGFDGTRRDYGGDDWEFAYRAFNNGAVLVHDPSAVAWHDEPDWADRDGGSKNDETMWLGRVIPEPLTRGPGIRQPWADTIVELAVDDAPAGAVVATASDVLTAIHDASLHLSSGVADAAWRHLAHDGRITTAAPDDRQRQRARRVIRLDGPVRWSSTGLRETLARVSPTGVGRLTVAQPGDGHAIATITSTRAAGRARRAPPGCGDVVMGSFGALELTAAAAGLEPISGDVDLAAAFGGW